ncbi:hypothetical protein O7635_21310 [Asanoa sp. WMMD1127]|uniref:hypothetical protein n=1 Tax=Asanoa sp. WMMD1127 TaxID=3016107 RepID=UPI002417E90A|nr:hypothetical protein [Asanoa sp. WMMD1127]MDG4824398.1 hypothetical protein [Asanoa sp. WMMD1127]
MVELLPKMAPEAPDGYVSFVDRHLAALRSESAQLAGDAWRAEEIYPEVLSDVAARWQWLELLATRFGRPRAADDYLRQVLTSRAKRWRAEQIYEVEMVVLRADPAAPAIDAGQAPSGVAVRPILGDTASERATAVAARPTAAPFGGGAPVVEGRPVAPFAGGGPVVEGRPVAPFTRGGPAVEGRGPAAPFAGGGLAVQGRPAAPFSRGGPAVQGRSPALPAPFTGGAAVGGSAGLARYRRTGPGRSSMGLKQAKFLSPLRHQPAPIAEAAIAWWHAYVAQRRRKRVAAVIAVILVLAALFNLRATNQI